MKRKSISKNYIYNILYEVLTLLVPLITTPYISRVLGVEDIGLYSYTYSIVSYFVIVATLGTHFYGRREISYYQDDIEKNSKIFWEVFIMRSILSLFCLIIYGIFSLTTDYKIISFIQSFYILSVIFDVTWYFQGTENFGTVILRNSLIKIINIIFIFAFVKTRTDLTKYIFGLAFLPFLAHLITWPILLKQVKKVPLKSLKPFNHFKSSLILFIPSIASQVYLLLDKIMIGIFSSNTIENGYYEQSQKIITICWTFLTTFSTVMAPRIALNVNKNNEEKVYEYLKKSFSIMWILSTSISFGLIAISSNFVPWFFGKEFTKVEILLNIFAWMMFPVALNSVIGNQYLITTKKDKVYTISIILGAVLNLILNLILIPKYYSVGAAIASVAAQIAIALYQLIHFLKDGIMNIKTILKNLWHCLLAGTVMFIILKILSGLLMPSIVNTLFLIMLGACIYLSLLLFFKDEILLENSKKILTKLKKSK